MGFVRNKRLKKESSSFQNINHSLKRGDAVFFTDDHGDTITGVIVGFSMQGDAKVRLDDGSGTVIVQKAELISEDEDMTDEGRDEYLLSRYKYNRRSPLPISNNKERRIIYGENDNVSTPEIDGIDPLDSNYSNTFKEEDAIQSLRLDTKSGLIYATLNGVEYTYKPIEGIDIYSLYQDVVRQSKSNQSKAIQLLQKSAIAGVVEGQELTEYSVGYELPTTQVPSTPQAFFPILPVLDDLSGDRYTDMGEWRDAINSDYPGVEYISTPNGQILAYAHNRNPALVGTYDIANNSGMVTSNSNEPMIGNDVEVSITEDSVYAVLFYQKESESLLKTRLSRLSQVTWNKCGNIHTATFKRPQVREAISALCEEEDVDEILSRLEPGKDITISVTPFDDVEVISGVTDDGDKLISALVNDKGEVMDLDDTKSQYTEDNQDIAVLSDMERELDDTFELTNTITLVIEYSRDPDSFTVEELEELRDDVESCASKYKYISDQVFDLMRKVIAV